MNQLHECMTNKQYNKLMLLLDLGHHPGELDEKDCCLLSKAIRSIKNLETRHAVVKKLLECGSEINCIDENGFTPLERAVKKKDIGMVQFLIQNGAEPNFNRNISPLILAIKKNDFEM
jgi:ankyrin repeat protein